jgi:SAM-dependent methyltransferase
VERAHRDLLRAAIFDEKRFVRATFGGRRRGEPLPWKRVMVRPIQLKGTAHIQFTYSVGNQDVTKNWRDADAVEKVDELLSLPFGSFLVETTERRLRLQITRRGKTIVHEDKLSAAGAIGAAEHDRRKDLPLPVGEPDRFLERAGIATPDGRVRPGMRRKFRQINEFLRLVLETGVPTKLDASPLHIVDCGCGSALLTFAIYHFLNHKLERPTRVTGIDTKEDLLTRLAAQSAEWGWDGLVFETVPILGYEPSVAPAIVLALHACDTATDEALAQAVRWESEMIFCVPCCQHHLQQQITPKTVPPDLFAVARHGILRERLGDLLTDGLRAQILRILGYRTDVVEFVSAEHTAKNLMIRAVRTGSPGSGRAVKEYHALVGRWQVKPYLGELLADELAAQGV